MNLIICFKWRSNTDHQKEFYEKVAIQFMNATHETGNIVKLNPAIPTNVLGIFVLTEWND